MTAELLAASDAGRARIAIGRASDFFGAGVTESSLGTRVFGNALAGKRADFLGDPDLPHSYSYVPDIAAGLATLGTDERAVGQVWHLPGPETVTTRALLDIVAHEVNHPVPIRSVPQIALTALGLANPPMRALAGLASVFAHTLLPAPPTPQSPSEPAPPPQPPPTPQPVTTRARLALVPPEVNPPGASRRVPKFALHALGLVNPMMRALA